LHAIALDPAFQTSYLTDHRGVKGGVSVGEWRVAAAAAAGGPPSSASSSSSARRSVRYMTSTAGGGPGDVRVECVEAQTAVPAGGEAASGGAAAAGWALRIAAGTPGLPLYGGAFHTEVTLVCTPAAGPGSAGAAGGGDRGGDKAGGASWSRVTVWGRVVWSARVLGLARRALERAAGGGLGTAYAAHAAALGAAAGGVAPVPEPGGVGLAGVRAKPAPAALATPALAPTTAATTLEAAAARAAARAAKAARAATRDGAALAVALAALLILASIARSLAALRAEVAALRLVLLDKGR